MIVLPERMAAYVKAVTVAESRPDSILRSAETDLLLTQKAWPDRSTPEPEIFTCADCRATYETGTKCEPCSLDDVDRTIEAQAAPGQPFPDDGDPEEQK